MNTPAGRQVYAPPDETRRSATGDFAPSERVLLGNIVFFDPALNDGQKAAVKFSLELSGGASIHGPPGIDSCHDPTHGRDESKPRVIGTRKTHTVMSTCHFSGVRQLYKHSFDVVIIDEATQAMEAVSPSLCRRRRALRSGLGLLDTDIQSQETHPCGRPDAITPNH